ncbi:toxin [Streptomyces sp. NRRL WC-3723]|nr:toxin [Streptomyces sp. NRRL WC-3723]
MTTVTWRKSSYSNPDGGECLEVSDDLLLGVPVRAGDATDMTWRKSSYSNPDGGNCLEVSDDLSPAVPVRDSKAPDGPALLFAAGSWSSFVGAVRTGALR